MTDIHDQIVIVQDCQLMAMLLRETEIVFDYYDMVCQSVTCFNHSQEPTGPETYNYSESSH